MKLIFMAFYILAPTQDIVQIPHEAVMFGGASNHDTCVPKCDQMFYIHIH